jgi:hypothetical protein
MPQDPEGASVDTAAPGVLGGPYTGTYAGTNETVVRTPTKGMYAAFESFADFGLLSFSGPGVSGTSCQMHQGAFSFSLLTIDPCLTGVDHRTILGAPGTYTFHVYGELGTNARSQVFLLTADIS